MTIKNGREEDGESQALRREVERLRQQVAAQDIAIRDLSALKVGTDAEQSKLKAQAASLARQHASAQKALADATAEVQMLRSRLKELESRMAIMNEKRQGDGRERAQASAPAAVPRDDVAELRANLEAARLSTASLTEEVRLLEGERTTLKAEAEALRKAAAAARQTQVPETELQRVVAAKNMHISKLEEQVHQLTRDVRMAAQYKLDLEDAQAQIEQLAAAAAAAEAAASVQTAHTDTFEAQLAEARAAVVELATYREELESARREASRVETLESDLEDAKARIQLLESDAAIVAELSETFKSVQAKLAEREPQQKTNKNKANELAQRLQAKEKEILFLKKRLAELKGTEAYKDAMADYRKQLADQAAQIEKLIKEKEELRKSKATVTSLRRQLLESRDANEEKHRRIVELMNQASEAQAKLAAATKATGGGGKAAAGAGLAGSAAAQAKEIQALKARCQELAGQTARLATLEETIQALHGDIEAARAATRDVEEERNVDSAAHSKIVEDLRKQLQNLARRNAELETSAKKAKSDAEAMRAGADPAAQTAKVVKILESYKNSMDTANAQLRTDAIAKDQKIGELQARLEEARARHEQIETANQSLREQVAESNKAEEDDAKAAELATEVERLKKDAEGADQLRNDLLDAQSRIRDLQLELDGYHKEMRGAGAGDQDADVIDSLRARIQELENELLEHQLRDPPPATPVRFVRQKKEQQQQQQHGGGVQTIQVDGMGLGSSNTSKISSSLLPADSYSYTVVHEKQNPAPRWKV